jgi:hypothetical protein
MFLLFDPELGLVYAFDTCELVVPHRSAKAGTDTGGFMDKPQPFQVKEVPLLDDFWSLSIARILSDDDLFALVLRD